MYLQKPWLKFYDSCVRHTLDYPDKPLSSLLTEVARKSPQQTAYIFYDKQSTYSELECQTNRFASALHGLGIKKGDRVAVMLPNCPQFVLSYYAIVKLGAIVVNTNPTYTERELLYQLNDAGVETLITFEDAVARIAAVKDKLSLRHVILTSILGNKPKLPDFACLCMDELIEGATGEAPPVEVNALEDVAVLQYTGGTTGVSKAVMLTHSNLVSNSIQMRERFAVLGIGMERVLTVLPLFHVYGMTCCMNMALISGGAMIMLPRFEAKEVLEMIRIHRPTYFPGVPTMYNALLNHPETQQYDLTVIPFYSSGAAPMPLELIEALNARLAGSKSVYAEGYGLSEASPVTHSNPVHNIRIGSIGLPYPDTECRIVDIETGKTDMPVGERGELVIKGPQVMKGYWNRPQETENSLRDGWLYTGDIATMDEDGYFYIVGRKKEMIIAGGFNIYPREVEEVLYELPQVQEAVVAGVPDKYRGESVKAYVVLKEGERLTEDEVITYCKGCLTSYKVPRSVEFRSELPKTNVGKLLRRVLIEEEKQRLSAAD
ncbi:MAG: long-chain fatty acid--CoA ligase [Dethiobacter sp.]|jgi:long-chain acyl-CoA synthetase|nr:long-chain fatty acid--CoA ligase [Dethiobacter sp.]